jgi:FAD/FMN-containing dehydrogenase
MTTDIGGTALRGRFAGELIRPGDSGYDTHRRVWNGSIDRHPALIARCADASDVAAAIAYARESELPLAVRGGGHSFPGLSVCDDGVVVDLGPMRRIAVDPERRSARAEGGVLLGELDRATQAFGLAVPSGAVTHTGIAGLTLGGGIGWLMRKHGLTIDQLESVDLVTADGRLITASEFEHPELFWAVRGGGGNFGVVTTFTYRLQPVGPTVLSSLVLWPLEDGPEVMRFYRDWAGGAPDELTTALSIRRAPATELIAAELHGRLVIGIVACWAGRLAEGDRVLRPMRTFGRPVADLTERRLFVEHQSMLDASFPPGLWVYMRGRDVAELTDDVAGIVIDHAARIESPLSTVTVWQLGGAVARVEPEATAFGNRASGHIVNITGATDSAAGFEQERRWVHEMSHALAGHQCGVYVNFLMDEGADRVLEAYGRRTYDRLAAVKRAYDPDNVFRINQNVVPG